MKALPLLTRGAPLLLGLLTFGCNQPDPQMQARLADAEARAKQAEAAVTELRRKAAEAPAASADGNSSAELAELKKKYAALEEANQQLQAQANKAPEAGANPLAGLDPKVVETSFINGFLAKKQEWKSALNDYQVKGYEQPEVTIEDVKPFRTTIGIRLEQAGRAFTAQVPVTADFQGNWTFPDGNEVVGYARQAAAGGSAASPGAPAAPGSAPAVARNPGTGTAPAVSPAAPRPAPRDDAPEPVPFGGKNLIKLPPIKFPGDP